MRIPLTAAAILTVLLAGSPTRAQQMGRVVAVTGDADITSVSTGEKFTPTVGSIVKREHRIRTGRRSLLELQLDDGTKIIMREVTVLNVLTIKTRDKEPPTKVRLFTGKARLVTGKLFATRTLVVKTPTAVAGVRGTDFGVLASALETRIVVFKGTIDVASSAERIIKSYQVEAGEEIRVAKNSPPDIPRKVPDRLFNAWFDSYDIDESGDILRREPDKNPSIIDKLLRKKTY